MPAESALRVLDWIGRAPDEIVAAVAYCRLWHARPRHDLAFHEAKRLGLLAQDPVWRATPRGEGALIAAGLLEGSAEPRQSRVHVLWASSDRYPEPQFVAAWNDGLVDCWREEHEQQRADAEERWRDFDDVVEWEFWTTVEGIDAPVEAPATEEAVGV